MEERALCFVNKWNKSVTMNNISTSSGLTSRNGNMLAGYSKLVTFQQWARDSREATNERPTVPMASWGFDSPFPHLEVISPICLSPPSQALADSHPPPLPPIYCIIKWFHSQNKSKNNVSTKSWHTTAVTSLDDFSSTFWQLLKWNKVVSSSFS